MGNRMNFSQVAPEAYQAILGLHNYTQSTNIDPRLQELIKIRASQINGCAFCLDMHTRDAKKIGVDERHIHTLPAWRETHFFSPEERAVLALTEAITLVSDTHVPDEVYNQAKAFYSDEKLADIITIIITINALNRLAITTRYTLPEK